MALGRPFARKSGALCCLPVWLKEVVNAKYHAKTNGFKRSLEALPNFDEADPDTCLSRNFAECSDHGDIALGEMQTTLSMNGLLQEITKKMSMVSCGYGCIDITGLILRRWEGCEDPRGDVGQTCQTMAGHANNECPRWSKMHILQFCADRIPEVERRCIKFAQERPLGKKLPNRAGGGGGCRHSMPGFLYLLIAEPSAIKIKNEK